LVEVLGELQGVGVVGHRLVEQQLLHIEAPQGEVIGRQLRVQGEVDPGNVSGAGLLAVAGVGYRVADAPKQIELVGEAASEGEQVAGRRFARGEARRVVGHPLARGTGVGVE
jgi:hypothetical protein